MPGYKSIALAGVGTFGSFVLSELSKRDVSIKVLSREGSQSNHTMPSNAQIVSVDYSSLQNLKEALEGVEVVISTLTIFAYDPQENLARAAKAAGVQLFIPSEFGSPTNGLKDGLFAKKAKFHDRLEEIGIPYTLLFTGPWPDLIFNSPISGMLGFHFPSKVNVPGDGRQPVAWTSRTSIASFLAVALTTPSVPALPRIIRLQGNLASYRDIAALYERVKGVELEINQIPISEFDERLAKNPKDAAAFVLKACAEGKGGVGEPNGNELLPEWKPESLEEIVSRL